MANYVLRNDNLMENRVFGDYSFPLEVFYNTLSKMVHGFVDPHWHQELELTIVQYGEMEYQVNDKIFSLKQGKGVFSNSKCIHTARPYPDRDCIFYSIVFNPILIMSHENSSLNHYIDEVVDSANVQYVEFDSENEWQREILNLSDEISLLFLERKQGYDFRIKGKLFELWYYLYEGVQPLLKENDLPGTKNIQMIKHMLAFIQDNFTEKLTLGAIAESANISKSECCRLFKAIMKESPFTYLNNYRIQKSIPLLLSNTFSISQIAQMVGFTHASYYAEVFRRTTNFSPSGYKKVMVANQV